MAGSLRPAPWWPGSSYVNWVGIDGYYLKSSWQFAPLFGPTIGKVRTLTSDPILIAETGAMPAAGQPAKIADVFAGIRAYGLLGFVWFDSTNSIGQAFGISSSDALAAFRKGAGSYPGPGREPARAALVSATDRGSREPRVSAATAAAWRRRLRAHLALPSLPETDTIALDFAESQHTGLAAMIHLADAQAPALPPVTEAYPPWSRPPTPRQVIAPVPPVLDRRVTSGPPGLVPSASSPDPQATARKRRTAGSSAAPGYLPACC